MGLFSNYKKYRKRQGKAKLKKVSVSLPFGIGGAEWEADETEVRAAWSLYVELSTRIAIVPLSEDEGLIREALNSLYSLFSITREILRTSGPSVGGKLPSVGGIAIFVLNKGLRPFLSKWHPLLQHWESMRPNERSPKEHESLYPDIVQLREELRALQSQLSIYCNALAKIAGIEE